MYNQRKGVLCYLMITWICIKLNEEVVRKKVFFLRLVEILCIITVSVGGWKLGAVGVGCWWLLVAVVMPGCTEQNWESHLAGAFTLVNHGSFKLFRDRMRDRLTFCNNLYLFHFHLRFCLKLKIE